MKLLFVSQEYPPDTAHGGIATQTRAKALGLAARGHEVTVLSASTGADRTAVRDGAVQVVRIPAPDRRLPVRTDGARTIAWSLEVAAAVEALHGRQPFDLVEFAEYGAEGFVFLANRAAPRTPPVVVCVHGPTSMLAAVLGWPDPASADGRLAVRLEGECIERADAVCAASAWSADHVAAAGHRDRREIAVLHTGVDTARFVPPAHRAADRPTVVFAGKLARSKGVDVLARAALEVVPELPRLRVRLIGRAHEPRLVDGIRAAAARAGRPELFEFAGAVGNEDLPREFARAHVFAAPSPCEGGPGFVYLEAMACGLPAIACAGTGAAATVLGGELGALVPPGDVDALAGALRELLGDPDGCAALGRRAREHVVATADRERCIDRIEEFLAGVAAG